MRLLLCTFGTVAVDAVIIVFSIGGIFVPPRFKSGGEAVTFTRRTHFPIQFKCHNNNGHHQSMRRAASSSSATTEASWITPKGAAAQAQFIDKMRKAIKLDPTTLEGIDWRWIPCSTSFLSVNKKISVDNFCVKDVAVWLPHIIAHDCVPTCFHCNSKSGVDVQNFSGLSSPKCYVVSTVTNIWIQHVTSASHARESFLAGTKLCWRRMLKPSPEHSTSGFLMVSLWTRNCAVLFVAIPPTPLPLLINTSRTCMQADGFATPHCVSVLHLLMKQSLLGIQVHVPSH